MSEQTKPLLTQHLERIVAWGRQSIAVLEADCRTFGSVYPAVARDAQAELVGAKETLAYVERLAAVPVVEKHLPMEEPGDIETWRFQAGGVQHASAMAYEPEGGFPASVDGDEPGESEACALADLAAALKARQLNLEEKARIDAGLQLFRCYYCPTKAESATLPAGWGHHVDGGFDDPSGDICPACAKTMRENPDRFPARVVVPGCDGCCGKDISECACPCPTCREDRAACECAEVSGV